MSKTKKKQALECQVCGSTEEVDELEEGLVLCYTCEVEGYTYCNVCKKYMTQERAYRHRHTFETEHCEWYGVGGSDMDESGYEEIKTSLWLLLDVMGSTFAADLGRTIKYNKMGFDVLHTSSGLLGGTQVFCYLTGPWGHFFNDIYCHGLADYGEQLYKAFADYDEYDAEKAPFYYGFMWLFGLGDDTPEENVRTRAWIREWAKARKASPVLV